MKKFYFAFLLININDMKHVGAPTTPLWFFVFAYSKS
jgi:hypothetical protein